MQISERKLIGYLGNRGIIGSPVIAETVEHMIVNYVNIAAYFRDIMDSQVEISKLRLVVPLYESVRGQTGCEIRVKTETVFPLYRKEWLLTSSLLNVAFEASEKWLSSL